MSILKIRKFNEKFYLPIILAFLMSIVSCSKEALINNKNNAILKSGVSSNMTGEKIFRGIFFFEGDLSKNFPSLVDAKKSHEDFILKNPKFINKYSEFNNRIITEIKKDYPTLFTEIENTIKEGTIYQIKEILDKSSVVMNQVLLKEIGELEAHANIKIFNDNPNLYEEVISLNLNNEEELNLFTKKYSDKIIDYNTKSDINNHDEDEPIPPCVPGTFFCVHYIIAGVYSYVGAIHSVVGAVNFIGYAIALVRTSTYAWTSTKVYAAPPSGGSENDKAQFIYREIFEHFRK